MRTPLSLRAWLSSPLFLSVGLFLAACFLPALVLHNRFYSDNTHWVWRNYQSIPGGVLLLQGLILGWLRFNFTAFANLPLWAAWILFSRGRYRAAQACSTAALVLSIETLQLLVQPYPYDEAGAKLGFLASPHVGFFCWIASMAVIQFGSRRRLYVP